MPLSSNIVKKYMNRIFIETGSYIGDGIQAALDAGCEVVKSIDIAKEQYDYCYNRFKDNPKVQLFLGDVEKKIEEMMADVTEPVTLWLDAHGGPFVPADQIDPIYETLKILAKHPIKNHIILIDDQDMSAIPENEIQARLPAQLKQLLLEINPKYHIDCIDSDDCYGHVYKKFVLTAVVSND